jgi:hypothetical protein
MAAHINLYAIPFHARGAPCTSSVKTVALGDLSSIVQNALEEKKRKPLASTTSAEATFVGTSCACYDIGNHKVSFLKQKRLYSKFTWLPTLQIMGNPAVAELPNTELAKLHEQVVEYFSCLRALAFKWTGDAFEAAGNELGSVRHQLYAAYRAPLLQIESEKSSNSLAPILSYAHFGVAMTDNKAIIVQANEIMESVFDMLYENGLADTSSENKERIAIHLRSQYYLCDIDAKKIVDNFENDPRYNVKCEQAKKVFLNDLKYCMPAIGAVIPPNSLLGMFIGAATENVFRWINDDSQSQFGVFVDDATLVDKWRRRFTEAASKQAQQGLSHPTPLEALSSQAQLLVPAAAAAPTTTLQASDPQLQSLLDLETLEEQPSSFDWLSVVEKVETVAKAELATLNFIKYDRDSLQKSIFTLGNFLRTGIRPELSFPFFSLFEGIVQDFCKKNGFQFRPILVGDFHRAHQYDSTARPKGRNARTQAATAFTFKNYFASMAKAYKLEGSDIVERLESYVTQEVKNLYLGGETVARSWVTQHVFNRIRSGDLGMQVLLAVVRSKVGSVDQRGFTNQVLPEHQKTLLLDKTTFACDLLLTKGQPALIAHMTQLLESMKSDALKNDITRTQKALQSLISLHNEKGIAGLTVSSFSLRVCKACLPVLLTEGDRSSLAATPPKG